MAATIRLRGRRSDSEGTLESALPTSFPTAVTLAVDTDPASRSAHPAIDAKAKSDDLLEVDLGDGMVLWVTVEQYLKDTAQQRFSDRARKTYELSYQYPKRQGAGARGRLSWAVKGLKTLGIDVERLGALKTIDMLAQKIEDDRLASHGGDVGGLYHFDGTVLGEAITHADQIADGGRGPILIFIHGTFSTTPGSFANLKRAQPKVWERLAQQYDEGRRIFGFDHRSLTRSDKSTLTGLLFKLLGKC
ncbi:MAG: hypothetical protein AAFX85_10455 [Pseudomonadota bacterium]